MVLDGYVRVSQVRGREGESFISPAVQREQIEAWATMRGDDLGTVFEELDASGATTKRPMLEEAIARVEAGASEGIVVAKLDRFGRSLIHGLAAIERVQAAGGTFVSVQDGLDLSTDTGRLVLRVMLSLAEWELDRIRTGWRAARARAVARGVHMGGRAPAGYEHDESRRLRPHPHHGPVMQEVFRRRAGGASVPELVEFMQQSGVPTSYGNDRWSIRATTLMLANRVYLGELRNGDLVLEGAHPPLVEPVTWQLAQHVRRRPCTPHGQPTVAGGLVRCAGCGHVMQSHAIVRAGRRRRAYMCMVKSCAARANISGAVIEPHIEACFFEVLDTITPSAQTVALERDAIAAHADLIAFRDDPGILRALGSKNFTEGLAVRMRRERQATAALASVRDGARILAEGGREEWERRWPQLSIVERRETMAAVIASATVARGARAVESRVTIIARGSGEPIAPPAPSRRWDEARVETELRDFVDHRWPRDDEFLAEGRGPLLREIHATGGPARWARSIGTQPPAPRGRGYWTDDRIRGALAAVMATRSTWPTRRQLTALGYGGLYAAMDRRGHRAWEAEFGFARRPGIAKRPQWTEARVAKALDALCHGRTSYPSRIDFRVAGLEGLHQAIRAHHGGHERWARRLGLPRAASHRPPQSVRRWNDALVEERLRTLVADLNVARYPLAREFYAAGSGGLYRHIKATDGHTRWAQRLDLPFPTARPTRRSTP